MNDAPKLVESPLSQAISSGDRTVKVEICRMEDNSSWTLEVVDEYGNSTVWDDTFPTDAEALTEVKKTILAEGIDALIGTEDGKSNGDWE